MESYHYEENISCTSSMYAQHGSIKGKLLNIFVLWCRYMYSTMALNFFFALLPAVRILVLLPEQIDSDVITRLLPEQIDSDVITRLAELLCVDCRFSLSCVMCLSVQ